MAARRRRDADDLVQTAGVDYSRLVDRHVGDIREERERQRRAAPAVAAAAASAADGGSRSSTFDAFMRLAMGKDERTIADKINDPNRPSWSEFKLKHADKLDLEGAESKEMIAYRRELDAARDRLLEARRRERSGKRKGGGSGSDSDSHSDSDSDDSDDRRRRRRKKKKKKRRVEDEGTLSDAGHGSDHKAKKKKKKKKKKNKKKKDRAADGDDGPVRLSSYLASDESSADD